MQKQPLKKTNPQQAGKDSQAKRKNNGKQKDDNPVSSVDGLEERIGHVFKNRQVIRTALTHSSYSNEMRSRGVIEECNERLEFLGDSVLSVIVSDYIFKTYPDLPEGELSKVRAGTICEKALDEFARAIELGKYLYLGRGEELSMGRNRPSILADAFEALLAAIYLDDGIDEVRKFLLPYVIDEINKILMSGHTADYKSILQQMVQQEHDEILEYVPVNETGPAHKRIFTVEARLNNNVVGTGTAGSKREAEQIAAKEALSLFGDASASDVTNAK